MARIDEVKAHIEWMKDLFKILVAILVADIAGVSKLYLENSIEHHGIYFSTSTCNFFSESHFNVVELSRL